MRWFASRSRHLLLLVCSTAASTLPLAGKAGAEIVTYTATLTVSIQAIPGTVNPPAQTYTISGGGTTNLTALGAFTIPPGDVAGVDRSPATPGMMFPGLFTALPGVPLQSFFFGQPMTAFGFPGSPATIQGSFGPGMGQYGGFGGFNPVGGKGWAALNLGTPHVVPGYTTPYWPYAYPIPVCKTGFGPFSDACPCMGFFSRPLNVLGGPTSFMTMNTLTLTGRNCAAYPGTQMLFLTVSAFGNGWTTGQVTTATMMSPPPTSPLVSTATGAPLHTTPMGYRTIQLVTPIRIKSTFIEQVGSARLTVVFPPVAAVPAIGPWGRLAVGLSLLAGGTGIARLRRRRRASH